MSPRLEEDHEIPEIADLLFRVVDRHGGDAGHLLPAGTANRVDAAEAATVSDRQLRRVSAGAQVFRDLDLLRPLDHLIEPWDARDEADHRHEPRRTGMRRDELVDAAKAIDARTIFEIGRCRVLVPLAEAHQRLARPGIVVE